MKLLNYRIYTNLVKYVKYNQYKLKDYNGSSLPVLHIRTSNVNIYVIAINNTFNTGTSSIADICNCVAGASAYNFIYYSVVSMRKKYIQVMYEK